MGVREELIKAYCEKARVFTYRASAAVSPTEAHSIMVEALSELGGAYNEFQVECLLTFPEDCKIVLAREYSVCLYVFRGEEDLPDGTKVAADAVDRQEDGSIRYWWD